MTDRLSESGEPIKPVYGPDDLPPDLAERLGKPGSYPFTRGRLPEHVHGSALDHPSVRRFRTAKESNERYQDLVAAGAGGLSVAFDLPTQMGYDSDDPVASGEIGKVGVAIDSLEDMRISSTASRWTRSRRR